MLYLRVEGHYNYFLFSNLLSDRILTRVLIYFCFIVYVYVLAVERMCVHMQNMSTGIHSEAF